MHGWGNKFTASLLTSAAIINTAFLALELLPIDLQERFPLLRFYFIAIQVVGGLLFALDYATNWHRKEKKRLVNSPRRFAVLLTIIRWWLAFQLTVYGSAKIFGTQFAVSYIRNDQLFGSLSGFDLTWGYFGYSYTFAVIIGIAQIASALLLVWPRTVLAGVLLALPVMFNIVLINIFYSIAYGAFLNSIIISFGLLYILWWHRNLLADAFRKASLSLPRLNPHRAIDILPVAVVAIGFLYIAYLSRKYPMQQLEGKWSVERILRNGQPLSDNAWITDRHAWKNVYIERYGYISFCPNPYIFDRTRALNGFYEFNEEKKTLDIKLIESVSSDSIRIYVVDRAGDKMQWRTIYDQDTLVLNMSRAHR